MRGVSIESKLRGVERATGCEVFTHSDTEGKPLFFQAVLRGQEFTEYIGTGKDADEKALRLLHSALYRANGEFVRKAQDGKCAFCGRILLSTGSEVDHIKTRGAHGRDDRVENLRCLCPPCHRRRHGG